MNVERPIDSRSCTDSGKCSVEIVRGVLNEWLNKYRHRRNKSSKRHKRKRR